MQTTDFERFRNVIVGMAKMYEREVDGVLLDAYWLALREWPLEDFEAAAGHLMRESKFMPRPADFTALRRAGELTAGEAWDLVLSGARLEPHSRVARASQIVGGQRRIRMANIERDLPHIQRRFFEVYRELGDVESARDELPQLGESSRVGNGLRRIGQQR